MLDSPQDRIAVKGVLAYVTLIFGAWIVYVSALYPLVESTRSVPLRIFLNELIRACIFVAPVFLYLKFVARAEPLRYLGISAHIARGVWWGAVASIVYAALISARVLLFTAGGVSPKAVPVEAWFTSLTLSPFIEEVAFRGFLLQMFERVTGFWTANALSASLFVAIHFPGWIIVGGSTLVPDKVVTVAEVMLLGLALGYVFKRSQSLWASFVLHATNNLIATVFF